LDKAVDSIPTLRMLTRPFAHIETKARQLKTMLEHIGDRHLQVQLVSIASTAGGGALPLLNLPSKGVGINVEGISPNALDKRLRASEPPIIGRIEADTFIMDLRTIQDDELLIIKDAFEQILKP
jgi:L-seryl-tRNA(Ser) seleniumtransferase